MRKLPIWMISSFLVVLAGGAGAVCLPSERFTIREAPEPKAAISPDEPEMAALVLDSSVGMAGFIQGDKADHPQRIFKSVVSAAWDAMDSSIDDRAKPRGYALVNSRLLRAENYDGLLQHCEESAAPGSAGCTRESTLSNAVLFNSDAHINRLFQSLSNPSQLRTFEKDLFARDGLDLKRDLLLIVTDLQNNAKDKGAEQLGEFLLPLLSKGGETAVLVAPFRSIFSGSVFDLPGYDSGHFVVLDEKVQPFFVVGFGPPAVLQSFHAAFMRELSRSKLPLADLVEAGLAQWPMMTTQSAGQPWWEGRLQLVSSALDRRSLVAISELPHPADPERTLPVVELPVTVLSQAQGKTIELLRLDLGRFGGESAYAQDAPRGAPTRMVCWGNVEGDQKICLSDTTNELRWSLRGLGGWFRGPEVVGPRQIISDWLSGLWEPAKEACAARDWSLIPAKQTTAVPGKGPELDIPFGLRLSLSRDDHGRDYHAKGTLLLEPGPSDQQAFYRGDELMLVFDLTLLPSSKADLQPWLEEGKGWHLNSTKVPSHRTRENDRPSGLGDRLLGVGGLSNFLRQLFSGTPQLPVSEFQSRHGILVRFVE